jgi:transcription elongation factor/antiterminator RfaH
MNLEKKSATNWYIMYTYPNYEKKVQKILLQKNIDCYLPLQKVTRQWSDRKKLIDIPLFPNYIFINSTPHEKFEALNVTGVIKFISFNGQPAILPDKDVETIKKVACQQFEVANEQNFEKGDYVRVLEGPFAGMCGYLFERKGKTRFGFKLDAIDQTISIEICTSIIEKILPVNAN